jgi:hypothetical protein
LVATWYDDEDEHIVDGNDDSTNDSSGEADDEIKVVGVKKRDHSQNLNEDIHHNDTENNANTTDLNNVVVLQSNVSSPNISSISNDLNTPKKKTKKSKKKHRNKHNNSSTLQTSSSSDKISPIMAKSLHKNMCKDKKCQICSSNNKK